MATNYPTSLDTNPGDPTSTQTLQTGGHANLHSFAQDAIIAIQGYVGVTGSAVTTSLTYILNQIKTSMVVTAGGILYGNVSSALTNLAIGTTGQVLSVVGGLPAWTTLTVTPAGIMTPYATSTAPSGWLLCNGTAYSALTYPALALVASGQYGYGSGVSASFTASVLSSAAHGLVNTQIIFFSGTLPGGLTATTPYYVINATTNTFQVSLTSGGSAVTITGTGNVTYNTTFKVPDTRSRTIVGVGQATKVATITGVTSSVITVSGLTNKANNEYQTGEAIVFTATVAGNLSNGATYYVVRTGNLTFSLATSLANAQNGTIITLAGTETGFFTLTLTARAIGETGGEENHAMSATELLAHTHSFQPGNAGGSGYQGSTTSSGTLNLTTGSTGGNSAMSIMNPFLSMPWIIKT